MLQKIKVNGVEVLTNYRGFKEFEGYVEDRHNHSYSICDGNDKKTMWMEIRKRCNESDYEMLERLVNKGYKRISFYYTTTAIRGIYDTIAYCK